MFATFADVANVCLPPGGHDRGGRVEGEKGEDGLTADCSDLDEGSAIDAEFKTRGSPKVEGKRGSSVVN